MRPQRTSRSQAGPETQCTRLEVLHSGKCDEIETCSVRTHDALSESGGWGIRWCGGNHGAFSVSGKRGAELKLRDGRQILIGSQKPDQLAEAVSSGLARIRKRNQDSPEPFQGNKRPRRLVGRHVPASTWYDQKPVKSPI